MAGTRNTRSKEKAARGGSTGRRAGRNTTFQAKAYKDELPPVEPQDLIDPDSQGSEVEPVQAYFQATAMLDKGELLGELAELEKGAPDTRAQVEAEAAPKGCRLIIVAGPDIGTEWAFKQAEIVLGRDEDCELVLADIAVSRRHARILREGTTFSLTDLSSGNGTFLNGVRIQKEALVSGDEIVIGERTLRFVELNEAPPTGAAHPVPQVLASEPVVGSVAGVSAAKEPALRGSAVDVGVVPDKDGPAGSVSAPVQVDKKAEPRPGQALRTMTLVVAGLVVILLASVGGLLYQRFRGQARAEEERRLLAKREMLQAIELVKQLRFGDARILLDRVLAVEPEHARAKEYLAHAAQELKVWEALTGAARLAAKGRFTEALGLLDAQPEETAYAGEIARLKRDIGKQMAAALLEEARRRLGQGDLDGAMDLALNALSQAPNLAAAQALRDEIQEAKDRQGEVKPKRLEIPPELTRAVALYKNEQIGPAIDAAEAAGGPHAATFVARMKRAKELLEDATLAHKKKAGAELLRIVPAALEVDQQVADGDGKVRARLKAIYADGLYLKGIEANQDKDYARAFELWTNALRQNPQHRLSESRLSELASVAKELYYEAYVQKDSNGAEAKKTFRRVVQMTRPDNEVHRLAKKWLSQMGG